MAWLLFGLALAGMATAALLGHLGWVARGARAVRERVHPPPEQTDHISIEQLAADLHRLAEGLEGVHRQDQPAKMARLTAAALAYDWVLVAACRTLDMPVPEKAPLDPLTRLEAEAALARQGLTW